MAASTGAIDVQQHFAPAALVDVLEEMRPGTADFLSKGTTTLEPRLEEMDQAGIELGLLSLSELGQYRTDRREADVALAQRYNDATLAATSEHSSRFRMVLTLPFPHADECIAEFDRLKDESLVKGVIAFCATEHYTLDDPTLDPVYDAIAKARMPLFLHPAFDQLPSLSAFGDWRLAQAIPPMVESSTTAARMMLSGTLDRVPNLTLVIPHLGGFLPYLAQRLVDIAGEGDAEHDIPYYLKNHCVFDSCNFHHPALDVAFEMVGPEQIMLASDYPFRGSVQRAVDDIAGSSLSNADQAAVTRGNAERLGLAA